MNKFCLILKGKIQLTLEICANTNKIQDFSKLTLAVLTVFYLIVNFDHKRIKLKLVIQCCELVWTHL